MIPIYKYCINVIGYICSYKLRLSKNKLNSCTIFKITTRRLIETNFEKKSLTFSLFNDILQQNKETLNPKTNFII